MECIAPTPDVAANGGNWPLDELLTSSVNIDMQLIIIDFGPNLEHASFAHMAPKAKDPFHLHTLLNARAVQVLLVFHSSSDTNNSPLLHESDDECLHPG